MQLQFLLNQHGNKHMKLVLLEIRRSQFHSNERGKKVSNKKDVLTYLLTFFLTQGGKESVDIAAEHKPQQAGRRAGRQDAKKVIQN
jgi:hypothetical protein